MYSYAAIRWTGELILQSVRLQVIELAQPREQFNGNVGPDAVCMEHELLWLIEELQLKVSKYGGRLSQLGER